MQLITRLSRALSAKRQPEETPVVVAHSNGAELVRMPDGKRVCQCPYACLAAFEGCEFGLYDGIHG